MNDEDRKYQIEAREKKRNPYDTKQIIFNEIGQLRKRGIVIIINTLKNEN